MREKERERQTEKERTKQKDRHRETDRETKREEIVLHSLSVSIFSSFNLAYLYHSSLVTVFILAFPLLQILDWQLSLFPHPGHTQSIALWSDSSLPEIS